MINQALFSSNKLDWETPDSLYSKLDYEFNFSLDAAADESNYKHNNYLDESLNALAISWVGLIPGSYGNTFNKSVYLNPPYGRNTGKWVAKAYQESQTGNLTVVCLLPARTDVKWFQEYIPLASEVRFIKGRVRFKGAKSAAPFPSMIVVFRPAYNLLWRQGPVFSCVDYKTKERKIDGNTQ